MIEEHDWAPLLVERIPNSAGAESTFCATARVDGQPHGMGRRVREACAVIGRAVKRGEDLGYFMPHPVTRDVSGIARNLHALRHEVLSGVSAPGRWASLACLQQRCDIWLLCDVPRVRSTCLRELTLSEEALGAPTRCMWIANQGRLPGLESAGEPGTPGLCLLSSQRIIEGAAAIALRGSRPPFVLLVDGGAVSDYRQLSSCIRRLRDLAQGAPLILVAGIGDQGSLLAAQGASVPAWILRAGDAARLDGLSAEQLPDPCFQRAPQLTGADLSSERLTQRIHIDLEIIEAEAMCQWAAPVFESAQELERFFPEDSEVIRRIRSFLRTLTSLCVPWRTYIEAFAASAHAGPYGANSIETELQALREVRVHTSEERTAFSRAMGVVEEVLETVRAPGFASGKQGALLQALKDTHHASQTVWLICANEPLQRSVRAFLGKQAVDATSGRIQVTTRQQLRRAAAEGALPGSSVLLPLHPLGFGDAFYFSGIASSVRLQVYDWEREAVEDQLANIGPLTQGTSPRSGSKLYFLTRPQRLQAPTREQESSSPKDESTGETALLWEIQRSPSRDCSVIPRRPAALRRASFGDSNWLQRARAEEDVPIETPLGGGPGTRTLPREHVMIELDDGGPPERLPPEEPVLVLPESSPSHEPMRGMEGELEELVQWTLLARQLRVDMEVLIPRVAASGDVLERLLDVFDVSGEYRTATHVNGYWRDAVSRIPDRIGRSAAKALVVLLQHGIPISSARTITRWKRGTVVGPRKAASILAVGLATEHPQLIRHPKVIHAAQAHIRSRRAAAFRRVNQLVRAGKSRGRDTIVDADLRICRADLDEFARIGRVRSVERMR